MKSLLFLLFFLFQPEVPFKSSEEFEVTLDYQYKIYKNEERKTIDYTQQRRIEGSQLYLVARVKLKKMSSDEVRVQVASNLENSMVNKKAEPDMVLKINFGFIQDVKDRVNANEYTVFLLSGDKKKESRIYLLIEPDGTFFVNGQKRGKF